jgi:hypothetical protein
LNCDTFSNDLFAIFCPDYYNITLCNNKYNSIRVIEHPAPQKQNIDIDSQHRRTKWATFTYRGNEKRKISKDTKLEIEFGTQSTENNIAKLHPPEVKIM